MDRHIKAAGLALAIAMAGATSAGAMTTFASFRPTPKTVTNLSWTNSGASNATLGNIPGDGAKEAGQTDVMFNFLAGALPVGVPADFSFSATSNPGTAVAFGVLLAQPGISGSFHFTYDGQTKTIDNVLFTH